MARTPTTPRRDTPSTGWIWGLALIAIAGIIIWIAADSDDAAIEEETVDETAEVEDLPDNPAAVEGQPIRVTGAVEQRIGDNAFLLGSDETGQQQQVLVIVSGDEAAAVEEGSEVTVMGEVRVMEVARIENDFDLELQDELFTPWTGRPIIVAQQIDQT